MVNNLSHIIPKIHFENNRMKKTYPEIKNGRAEIKLA